MSRSNLARPGPKLTAAFVLLAVTGFAAADVTVNGTGTVAYMPDQASIDAEYVVDADTTAAVSTKEAEVRKQLCGVIESAGVAAADIKTAGLTIYPRYTNPTPGGEAKLVGYQAAARLRLTVRDVAKVSGVLDHLSETAVNPRTRVAFSSTQLDKILDQARVRAVEEAERKARLFARAAKAALGTVQSIEEIATNLPTGDGFTYQKNDAGSQVVAEQSLSVTVRVSYALDGSTAGNPPSNDGGDKEAGGLVEVRIRGVLGKGALNDVAFYTIDVGGLPKAVESLRRTFDVSFPTAELRGRADRLDGKPVVLTGFVVGDFVDRAGKVVIRVQARKLEEAKESAPESAPPAGGAAAEEGPRLMLQVGHWARIESFALSPDGATLATCGDTSVRLWDLASGQLLRVLSGHDDYVLGAAFSPDGKWLASVQRFGKVRLWDLDTGQEIRSWRDAEGPSPTEPVIRFAGTKTEPQLILTGDGGSRQLTVWDPNTGKLIRRIDLEFTAAGDNVAVDPTGRRLAVVAANAADAERKGAVYDLMTGKKVLDWSGYGAVAFTADGKGLMFADKDGAIGVRMLDGMDSKDDLKFLYEKSGQDRILALALSPDGRQLAARDAAGAVTVWALGEAGGKIAHTWPKASGAVGPFFFTADGKFLLDLAPDSRDGLRLRNAATGEITRVVAKGTTQSIYWADFSPDGRVLHVETAEDKRPFHSGGRAWDLRTGSETPVRPYESSALSPDGKTLAAAVRTKSGATELRLSSTGGDGDPTTFTLDEVPGTPKLPMPLLLAFSPDGKRLGLRTGPVVAVFDVPARKRLGEVPLRGGSEVVEDFGFTADHQALLVRREGTLSAWDPDTQAHLNKLESSWPKQWKPAPGGWLSPDGRYLVGSNQEGLPPRAGFSVTVWDLAVGKETVQTGEFTATIGWTAFHPDGKSLWVVGDAHGIVRLDLATGKPMLAEPGVSFGGARTRLAVDANGTTLGVVEPDGTVSLRSIQADGLSRLGTLAVLGEKQWAVVARDRYDVGDPDDLAGLHAVRDGKPVSVTEVKEFRREPGLLARLAP